MEEHLLLKLFNSSLTERCKPETLNWMSNVVMNLAAEDELKVLDLVMGTGLWVTDDSTILNIRHRWSEIQLSTHSTSRNLIPCDRTGSRV